MQDHDRTVNAVRELQRNSHELGNNTQSTEVAFFREEASQRMQFYGLNDPRG